MDRLARACGEDTVMQNISNNIDIQTIASLDNVYRLGISEFEDKVMNSKM